MKLTKSILTKNDCYKANRKIKVKGLMIHSVGCPQPSASVFLKNWNKAGYKACVHAFIDGNTGEVYQTLPWEHRGWHGGGKSNDTHIGVEMCEPSTIKYTRGAYFVDNNPTTTKQVVMRTYKSAVELFAYLCKEYNLNPLADGVILSHSEGHKRGIATNHGDVEHLWKKFGLTMDGFRKDIKEAMGSDVVTDKKEETASSAFVPYKAKVTASVLNVRKGANTSYKITATVKKGEVYTIVDEKDGWGKLKSGAGWISLKYVVKI